MSLTQTRDKINLLLYKNVIRPVCFKFDPEFIHKSFISLGKVLGSNFITKKIIHLMYDYQNPILSQEIAGIKFNNPVGLAAGFDKNAEIIKINESLGFGFVEVGSITARPSDGNPGVRLKRILDKQALWINLGLNNGGAEKIYEKLSKESFKIPVGINIAKTNCKETADWRVGLKDYIYSIKKFKDIADYLTINISCPNAYGGQQFSDPKLYESLLKEVSKLNIKKPIFVKLSPDLSNKNIDSIIALSKKYNIIAGFVCSNLTKKHNIGKGGLSGKILSGKSDELLGYVYKKTKGKFILIGAGGIFSGEDAYRKIKLGANLVQLITGMIYEGPNLISEINSRLVFLLKRDGYENIKDAVGVENS